MKYSFENQNQSEINRLIQANPKTDAEKALWKKETIAALGFEQYPKADQLMKLAENWAVIVANIGSPHSRVEPSYREIMAEALTLAHLVYED